MEQRLDALLSPQRIRLSRWPTPLERLDRLREVLGCRAELFVKRDDATSLAFGGSKVRKLEVLAGVARARQADALVTIGTEQSNCARATAALAAKLGIECHLVLAGSRPKRLQGNLLLCDLLGARISYVRTNKERESAQQSILERLISQERQPLEVPLSAATPLGVLAMAQGFFEVLAEGLVPDVVFVCSSSGATQAGLLVASAVRGLSVRVVGVSPDDPADAVRERVNVWIQSAMELLEVEQANVPPMQIEVDDSYAQDRARDQAFGGTRALQLFARSEGLFLDPIYTSRAAAAFVDDVLGRRADRRRMLFWHTGGLPLLSI